MRPRPDDLVPPRRVRRDGGRPTPKEVRSGRWRRSSRGFYVPAHVDAERPEQRIVEAAAVVPDGCAITGWAALRWHGGRWFDGTRPDGGRRPITVMIGTHDIRPQPAHGIAVSGEYVGPHLQEVVDGVRVVQPAVAVAFEMRHARSARAAARVLSLAAYDDLVSLEDMDDRLLRESGWTGVPQARDGASLAVEDAWSPAEVDMGLVWHLDAGRPRPLGNRPVFDRFGRHLFTPDLIDAEAGVVGEYNGPTHREASAYGRDVDRWALCAEHGLELVVMSATDGRDTLGFERRLAAAYRRAARRTGERSWTLDPPPWWTPTHTVELRRTLTPEQAEKLLRYRAS